MVVTCCYLNSFRSFFLLLSQRRWGSAASAVALQQQSDPQVVPVCLLSQILHIDTQPLQVETGFEIEELIEGQLACVSRTRQNSFRLKTILIDHLHQIPDVDNSHRTSSHLFTVKKRKRSHREVLNAGPKRDSMLPIEISTQSIPIICIDTCWRSI